MKYIFFLGVLFLTYTKVYSQYYSQDTLSFSVKLVPYRIFLDSVARGINATEILAKYKRKISLGDTILLRNAKKEFKYYWVTKKESAVVINPKLKLKPAKYSVKEFREGNNGVTLFNEIEYNLSNREELFALRSEYEHATTNEGKILILLRYIRAVHYSTSIPPAWKFSLSYNLQLYLEKFQSLFKTLKNTYAKAELLIKYAETLEFIGVRELNMYIYSVYVEAETLLIAPYAKSSSDIVNWSNPSPSLKEYILRNKIGDKLIKVYYGIIDALRTNPIVNASNELYPIFKRIKYYQERVREVLSLLNTKYGTYTEELLNAETSILASFSSVATVSSEQIRYYSNEFQDRQYALDKYISRLLTPAKSALLDRNKAISYLTLGSFFEGINDNNYALKSYYMALSSGLMSNYSYEAEVYEVLFFYITRLIRKVTYNSNADFRSDFSSLFDFYKLINEQLRLSEQQHDPSFHTFKAITLSRFASLNGHQELAKKILIDEKKILLTDSSKLENNTSRIGLIYEELIINNWLEINKDALAVEKFLDSFVLTRLNFNIAPIPLFNNKPDFISDLEYMNNVENRSMWNYRTNILETEIGSKLTMISRLTKKSDSLNSEVDTLNQRFIKLNYNNQVLSNITETLKQDTAKLNKEIESKKRELKEVEGNAKFWSFFASVMTIIAVAIIVVAIFSMKKIRKEVSRLEVDKVDLEHQTKGLLSQLEANKKAYESNLRYENEKILKEHVLKHEIVGVTRNLVPTFQNAMAIILANPGETKSELTNFNRKLEVLDSYASIYYLTLNNEDYNSIDIEVELAKHYIEFWNLSNSNVLFHDMRTYKNTGIVMPPHIVNNLAKNAIEHGEIRGVQLNVTISDEREGNDYILKVSDDGIGVGERFSLERLNQESSGLKNMAKQIEHFNRSNKHKYFLEFGTTSIVDRKLIDGKNGTIITLKISEKNGN